MHTVKSKMQWLTAIWRSLVQGRVVAKPAPARTSRSRATSSDIQWTRYRAQESGPESEGAPSSRCCSLAMESGRPSDPGTERSTPITTTKILVVDDEDYIRDLVQTTLNRDGRHILLAVGGKDAIAVFRGSVRILRSWTWTCRTSTG